MANKNIHVSEGDGAGTVVVSVIDPDTGDVITIPTDALTTSDGWGNYTDTQYTSGAPFSIVADTDTVLPNNKGSALETYKQDNVTTYYDGTVITGRTGDKIDLTIDMKVNPTNAGTTYIEVWVDIGGAVGQLYRRILSFPKGNGVERPINFTVSGYTLDTWEANGATVYVRANGSADIYDIRYVIYRKQFA